MQTITFILSKWTNVCWGTNNYKKKKVGQIYFFARFFHPMDLPVSHSGRNIHGRFIVFVSRSECWLMKARPWRTFNVRMHGKCRGITVIVARLLLGEFLIKHWPSEPRAQLHRNTKESRGWWIPQTASDLISRDFRKAIKSFVNSGY